MRPGRLPVDYYRPANDPNHRRFSLSFAVCLILGPAIFIAILAYEGSLADDPAPFDDDPSHHHHGIVQNGPLRFCTYLDDNNHIQAKAGPCTDNSTRTVHHERKIAAPKDFCIEKMSNETFDIVDCSNSTNLQLAPRQLNVLSDLYLYKSPSGIREPASCDVVRYFEESKHPRSEFRQTKGQCHQGDSCFVIRPDGFPAIKNCVDTAHFSTNERDILKTPGGWCIRVSLDQEAKVVESHGGSSGDAFPLHEPEPLPPRFFDRAVPPTNLATITIADQPEKWTNVQRCTKDFCNWVNVTGEIRNRCYANNDKNPNTPPTPDEALKYTAPFECNLCLEDAKYGPDMEHIQRHCSEVAKKEEVVFKILLGVLGGSLLVSIICGIYWEHKRKKRPLKKPDLKSHVYDERFGRRSGRAPTIPPYDGTADLDLSMFSVTASQNDAPEIRIRSCSQSIISQRGVRVPVMPSAWSLKSRQGSVEHIVSAPQSRVPEEQGQDRVVSPAQSITSKQGVKIPVMPYALRPRSEEGSTNHATAALQALVPKGQDDRVAPPAQPLLPNVESHTGSSPHSRGFVGAEDASSLLESLFSEELRRMPRRRKCVDCSSSMSEIGNHRCNKVRCSICKQRMRSSDSTDHAAVCLEQGPTRVSDSHVASSERTPDEA